MKKPVKKSTDPDMLDHYDFSDAVRGKHAASYAEGTNLVILDPDVAKVFSNSKDVNDALRAVLEIVRVAKRKKSA